MGLVLLAFCFDDAAAGPKLEVPKLLAQYFVVQSLYQRVHLALCYTHPLSRRRTTLVGHIVGIDLLRVYGWYAIISCVVISFCVISFVTERLHSASQ